MTSTNFNPRAPCGARRGKIFRILRAVLISIHAPLAGRDLLHRDYPFRNYHFNPRAPCGARHHPLSPKSYHSVFQSTRPLRGATASQADTLTNREFQSTRPLRGATSAAPPAPIPCWIFQSTRPLRGATTKILLLAIRADYFNPRAPCGARRASVVLPRHSAGISIHAPLAGRDSCPSPPTPRSWYFNPRAPCGARRSNDMPATYLFAFQSTRPLRCLLYTSRCV